MLISIQSLILCAEPYYNEPGFERLYGTPQGDSESLKYSEEVFRNNLKYAVVGQLTNPPEGFEDVVRAHFYLKQDFLLQVHTATRIYNVHTYQYLGTILHINIISWNLEYSINLVQSQKRVQYNLCR